MAKSRYLRPVRPSAAVRARYQAALVEMIKEMSAEVTGGVRAEYGMAMDAPLARTLASAIDRWRRKWLMRFAELAPRLAEHFARGAGAYMDAGIKTAMRDAGFTVQMQVSPGVANVLQAGIVENVALIKSIPEQYFTAIEGDVMRSVAAGRDLGTLTKALEANYGVTHRRAALIARDQNNKASAMIERQRRLELLGEDAEAEWRHTGAPRKPRPSHVLAGAEKRRFKVREGCLIDGEYIQPGELINCTCTSRLIIPGLLTRAS